MQNQNKTRLHSSRMHTTRLLTVSPSMHCAGVCSQGRLHPVGLLPRDPVLRGRSVPGGWYSSMHWGRPPPVNRMTDNCKNITLPQTSVAGGNKLTDMIQKKMLEYQLHHIDIKIKCALDCDNIGTLQNQGRPLIWLTTVDQVTLWNQDREM